MINILFYDNIPDKTKDKIRDEIEYNINKIVKLKIFDGKINYEKINVNSKMIIIQGQQIIPPAVIFKNGTKILKVFNGLWSIDTYLWKLIYLIDKEG